MSKNIPILSIALCLSACTSNVSRRVNLSETISFLLPSSTYIQQNKQVSQIVSGRYKGHDFTLQIEVETSSNKMVIVGLGPWGQQLFSVIYANDTLTLSSIPSPVKQLPPQYVLADILLTHLEKKDLQKALQNASVTVKDTPLRRQFYSNDTLLIDISYTETDSWKGTIVFKNLVRSYQVTVENIP